MAAAAVFYMFIYRPEEQRKREARERAVVSLDKKNPTVGKYRPSS